MQATQKHLLKLFSKFVTMPRVCIFVICCLICAVSSRRTSAGDDEAVELQDSIAVTACTVVQAVVKANSQSNGNGQISTPWGSKTPQRISMKLGIYNGYNTCNSIWRCDNVGRLGEHDLSHVSASWYAFLFGRPFVKRFALRYRTIILYVLSVTLVYCGQTVGGIKMKLGMQVGVGPGHIVSDGDPAPLP